MVDDDDHDEYHPMSYVTKHCPVLTGEIKSPVDDVPKMPLDVRKVIARRASQALKPGQTVNLGIGLPEGVASVAGEEGILPFITLTTEPGSFGGLVSDLLHYFAYITLHLNFEVSTDTHKSLAKIWS